MTDAGPYRHLMAPLRIRNTTLPNRVVFAPVCPTWVRSPHEGIFTEQAAPAPRENAPAEEVATPAPQEAEFVSLEDAEAEAQGAKGTVETTEPDIEEDVEMDESLDDATFIEEQEEEDGDVTDIIGGDIEDEEEG